MESRPKVAVIGAGVVGLTAALMLQEKHKGAKVTIVADKFKEKTTSWVAAGIFRPGTDFAGSTEELTKAYVRDSWNHWNDIYLTSDAPKAGVALLSGYIFSKTDPAMTRNHLLEGLVPVYRDVSEEELRIHPGGWKYGSFFTTLLIEYRLYQVWAEERFLKNGGVIIEQKVNTFEDLGDYDLVLNCSGFGAKKLCNDRQVSPIRGQVFKVKAPWVKMFFYDDYDTYIIPGFDAVTLGGTRQFGSYNTEANKHDSAAILERCISAMPGLKNAPIVEEAVGLRPYRPIVRVEKENFDIKNGKKLKVVHCYGHGAYGVTVAPGTAKHAVELALQMLHESKL